MGSEAKKRWAAGGFQRVVAAATFLAACTGANAFEIKTGNADIEMRWDNTFKYSYAYRVSSQEQAFLKNPNTDDGNRNFDVGTVLNRADVLSEFDFSYKKNYGLRISGDAWYDLRYHQHLDNDSPFTSNHLDASGNPSVGLSDYAKRYYAGPSGELLDAFVYGRAEIAGMPVSARVGRHSVYWGESLLGGGSIHGISYAQMPIDFGKALAVPGAEAKELFRPLNHVSVQVQPSETLTLAGQYFLQWEEDPLMEAGTYNGFSDAIQRGAQSLIVGFNPATGQLVRFTQGKRVTPKDNGDWGVSARWAPNWLYGTLGAYYRNFSDRLPQVGINPAAGQYFLSYGSDIDLYGISLAKTISGVSVGAELSYRVNMPLNSDAVVVAAPPRPGETVGTRGETVHGVVNMLGLLSKTPVYDAANWLAEFTWNRWTHVSQGAAEFKGRDGYVGIDKVARDFVGAAVNFTPTWFQVLPGLDLSLPLHFDIGLLGNSAVNSGGNKNTGTYSAGIAAELYQKYQFNLAFVNYYGGIDTDPATGALTVANGPNASLRDRGMITFSAKATF